MTVKTGRLIVAVVLFLMTSAVSQAELIEHRIRFGETLWSLSRRYNASLDEIMRVNDLSAKDYLVVGQTLIIPAREPEESEKSAEPFFRSPLKGRLRITSPFGVRIHPITRRRQQHTGIDIAASVGTRVYCAAVGRVRYAGGLNGYGRTIIVDHANCISTLYAHLSSIFVRTGQTVRAGSIIGLTGDSGRTTGPHLHFEVRVKNAPVNPAIYIDF